MKTAAIFGLALFVNPAFAQVKNAYRYIPLQKSFSITPQHFQDTQIPFELNTVQNEGSEWIRLFFSKTESKISRGTRVKLVGADGAQQILSGEDLENWAYSSAYFNGDRVQIEVLPAEEAKYITAENAGDRLVVEQVQVDDRSRVNSICNQVDQRVLSHSPRDARMFPTGKVPLIDVIFLFGLRLLCLVD